MVRIPEEYICSLTHEIMLDPVFTTDGESYERAAIADWFSKGNNTSPRTNLALDNQIVVPNLALKRAINDFIENNRAGFEQELLDAVKQGNVTEARSLMRLRLDLNVKDSEGYTYLHHAASQGYLAMVDLLLENGATPQATAKVALPTKKIPDIKIKKENLFSSRYLILLKAALALKKLKFTEDNLDLFSIPGKADIAQKYLDLYKKSNQKRKFDEIWYERDMGDTYLKTPVQPSPTIPPYARSDTFANAGSTLIKETRKQSQELNLSEIQTIGVELNRLSATTHSLGQLVDLNVQAALMGHMEIPSFVTTTTHLDVLSKSLPLEKGFSEIYTQLIKAIRDGITNRQKNPLNVSLFPYIVSGHCSYIHSSGALFTNYFNAVHEAVQKTDLTYSDDCNKPYYAPPSPPFFNTQTYQNRLLKDSKRITPVPSSTPYSPSNLYSYQGITPLTGVPLAQATAQLEADTRIFSQEKDELNQLFRAANQRIIQEYEEVLRLVESLNIEAPVNLTQGNLLHLAVIQSKADVIRRLIVRGAINVNNPDEHGWTPLHWAIYLGLTPIVELLLDLHADINALAPLIGSALHIAILYADDAMVSLLVRRGANIESKNALGQTPRVLALEIGNLALAGTISESYKAYVQSQLSIIPDLVNTINTLQEAVARLQSQMAGTPVGSASSNNTSLDLSRLLLPQLSAAPAPARVEKGNGAGPPQ